MPATPLVLAALAPTTSLIVAAIVVIALILIWKFVKFAFKIALVVGLAVGAYLLLGHFGIL